MRGEEEWGGGKTGRAWRERMKELEKKRSKWREKTGMEKEGGVEETENDW